MIRQHLRSQYLRTKSFMQAPVWNTVWSDHINFLWYDTKNWGDALNPVLIEQISGRKGRGFDINLKSESGGTYPGDVGDLHLLVGSTLQHADANTVVWGAGFTSNTCLFAEKPKQIYAVRGPLSAAHARSQGVSCPDIFGDPALLFPRYYHPKPRKQYSLGIIPHYLDSRDPKIERFRSRPDILVIDIKDPIEKVVDDLCKCDCVASSSLHGLIAADAYEIPSAWIKVSAKIPGNDFKFYDYFASLGLIGLEPIDLTEATTVFDLINGCNLREVTLDLDRLLDACPFSRDRALVA
ncbi:polysaccharide pyruvyl transferase family protein [Synechococcus sp. PCC 7336]|uniref:polysaccharide pyruvyl transferase family protein n=1 Tax=Synechococcus sp. PCC 7336 TaxID=195250 RepID=UPI00034DF703|nr:polysaccharide pyruvyl transferase family protein [Synechococcus sp. PCC 7336]